MAKNYLEEFEERKIELRFIDRVCLAAFYFIAIPFIAVLIITGIYRLITGHDFNINNL